MVLVAFGNTTTTLYCLIEYHLIQPCSPCVVISTGDDVFATSTQGIPNRVVMNV